MNYLLQNRVVELLKLWETTGDPRSQGNWAVYNAIIESARQRPREFTISDYWEEIAQASCGFFVYGVVPFEEALNMQTQAIRTVLNVVNS